MENVSSLVNFKKQGGGPTKVDLKRGTNRLIIRNSVCQEGSNSFLLSSHRLPVRTASLFLLAELTTGVENIIYLCH
jgi:hypothetical protein